MKKPFKITNILIVLTFLNSLALSYTIYKLEEFSTQTYSELSDTRMDIIEIQTDMIDVKYDTKSIQNNTDSNLLDDFEKQRQKQQLDNIESEQRKIRNCQQTGWCN